jgi:hypothetical protein
MKNWRLRRLRRRVLPAPDSPPEFGVGMVLKKGDKVVSRDPQGAIHILTIHDDDTEQGRRGQEPDAR